MVVYKMYKSRYYVNNYRHFLCHRSFSLVPKIVAYGFKYINYVTRNKVVSPIWYGCFLSQFTTYFKIPKIYCKLYIFLYRSFTRKMLIYLNNNLKLGLFLSYHFYISLIRFFSSIVRIIYVQTIIVLVKMSKGDQKWICKVLRFCVFNHQSCY